MRDMERDLRDMMQQTADGLHYVPRPSRRLVRRARWRRAQTATLAGAAAVAVAIGGFAGARSLTSDEALPPAEEDPNVSPFVDTWTSTDLDGSTQTMVVRESGEDAYEIVVRDDSAGVCSDAPSTMKGTGRLDGGGELVIPSPVLTCDDGSEPKVESGPPLEEQLRNLSFVHDPGTDTLTDSFGVVWRRPGPPAEEESSGSAFVGTWTTTNVDGSTRRMVIRTSGEDAYEITVQNHLALVCSGAPSTLTGTGQLNSATELVIPSPEITCDDESKPKVEDDLPPPEELLSDLTFEYDPESDILTNYSPLERRRIGRNGQVIYSGLTLVWHRAEAENRIGDVSGWITYGDKRGIWARDLTSPGDPADRVRLSSTPGSPIAWSRDGSKLLVSRDEGLFVLNSDRTETRLAAAEGGSFSPDGTAVVYAVIPECYWQESGCADRGKPPSAIYVVDAEGGSPRVLLAAGSRRYPDDCGTHTCMRGGFETALQEPKWSPDGSQIAYFDGMVDWGHSLRVVNSDGTGARVVLENGETLGGGHVYGLEWSPDGRQLAFSIGGRLYVVGVDGSGFRLVADDGVDPYWSPDGSHIAYTRDPEGSEGGSLEIVRLDDLQVQNFGDGESGPWTAELHW